MDHQIKLSPRVIETLKKANTTYPLSGSDYDKRFMCILLKAVFTKDDLVKCSQTSLVSHLNRVKLKFVKAVFAGRVENDKARLNSFRALVLHIGDYIASKN